MITDTIIRKIMVIIDCLNEILRYPLQLLDYPDSIICTTQEMDVALGSLSATDLLNIREI